MRKRQTIALAAALLAAFAVQAQTTYRWVDPASGRTIFSDQAPPSGARQISKREAEPAQEAAAAPPYATRVAAEKYPVVLYTSPDCTEQCTKARGLLDQRGIPFREKTVQIGAPELEELKALTGGKAFVPVVVVGRQHLTGFQSSSWSNLLDLAGYPKTAPFASKPSAPPAPPAAPAAAAPAAPAQ